MATGQKRKHGQLDVVHEKRDTGDVRSGERRGAYTADRAAALSGVPKSTVHYWARREILVPSVSAVRVKLWSYTDLMGLRTIYWLRRPKRASDGWDVPPTTMTAVRKALAELRELDLTLWTEQGGPAVVVDRAGDVYVRVEPGVVEKPVGVRPLDADLLEVIEPFSTLEGTEGPNLQAPRPNLRIVPGKLSGSPHIVSTRIETIAIAALGDRDLDPDRIHALYPVVASVRLQRRSTSSGSSGAISGSLPEPARSAEALRARSELPPTAGRCRRPVLPRRRTRADLADRSTPRRPR